MTVPVRYHCPRCGAIVTLERDAYLADKSVTPIPVEGWAYAAPGEAYESADGVRFVCGEADGFAEGGCGEPFYLNFVRFEDGREVEPAPEREPVALADPNAPVGPRFPRGPGD